MRIRDIGLICALAVTTVAAGQAQTQVEDSGWIDIGSTRSVVPAKAAQTGAPQRRNEAAAKKEVGPPYFTYTAKYYGFVTSSTEIRKGHNISADEIRKSVAAGGRYVLLGSPGGRKDIDPQEKAAPFAGQQVFMTLSVTSQKYGTGPTSDPSIEGYPAGGDRPATRTDTYQIVSVTPTTYNDAWQNVPPSYWRGKPQ